MVRKMSFAACKLCVWLLLFLLSVHGYDNVECDALNAFKESLGDPYHVLESWDPSLVTPCTWFHVSCDTNNRVVRLDLGNASLKGALVPQLGKLSQLQYFELHDNELIGSIPLEFGNLKKLVSLDLYNNHLTGKIPATLGHLFHLRYLRMNNNNLSGIIPASLTNLPLQVLDLSYNNLEGPVPSNGSFGSLAYKNFTGNPHLCTNLCTSNGGDFL